MTDGMEIFVGVLGNVVAGIGQERQLCLMMNPNFLVNQYQAYKLLGKQIPSVLYGRGSWLLFNSIHAKIR